MLIFLIDLRVIPETLRVPVHVLWVLGKNHILVRELLSLPCVCMMAADIKNHLTAVLCKRTDLLNIIVMRQFCGPRYTNITSCWGCGRLPNSYIIDGLGGGQHK